MSELWLLLTVVFAIIGFYLNYRVYQTALEVYHNDVRKASQVLQYGGERLLRKDLDDPFYHNDRKELQDMLRWRSISLSLFFVSLVIILLYGLMNNGH